MIAGLIVRVVGWVGSSWLAKWVGTKVLLMAALGVAMTLLWNLLIEFMQAAMTWGTGELAGVSGFGGSSPVVQLTGLAAYFALQFKLPQAVAFMITVEVARFTIKVIAGLVPGLGGLR